MSEDWDDLFAAAAGDDNITTLNTSDDKSRRNGSSEQQALTSTFSSHQSSPPLTSNNNVSKKNKKKRKSKSKSNERNPKKRFDHHQNDKHGTKSSLFHAFLQSRMDPIEKQIESFPSWLSLDKSFCQDTNSPLYCTRYEPAVRNKNNKTRKATLSPLYYSSKSNINDNVLKSISFIRNLRCCCSCIYEISSSKGGENKSNKEQEGTIILSTFSELVNYCIGEEEKHSQFVKVDLLDLIPMGERHILTNKFESIREDVHQLHSAVKELHNELKTMRRNGKKNEKRSVDKRTFLQTFHGTTLFDSLVALIVSLDATYFRLYYLQIAGYLPISTSKNGGLIHVPHPTTYFGVDNLTWNVKRGKKYTKNILTTLEEYLSKNDIDCKSLSSEERTSFMKHFGFVDDANNRLMELDPLTFLHTNRKSEGFLLFFSTSWVECNETYFYSEAISQQKQNQQNACNNSADDNFYLNHETDAPKVLKEWRDSCRDLLCNLYGYATVSPDALKEVKNVVDSYDGIGSIIEMGAGTGYLANLLNKIGLKTTAFDIAPTKLNEVSRLSEVVNEYHGSTAPFIEVERGDANTLKHLLKSKGVVAKSAALLLCYPPPRTNMAYDMLQIYKKAGGQIIIHIGEFKGLTGSADFEKQLRSNYKITKRLECLHWGTDSSEVTIWCRKEKDEAKSMLLPCSNCHENEALKHCRFSRPLRYCDEVCFTAHHVQRSMYLTLNMIPVCPRQINQFPSFESPSLFYRTL